MIRQSLTILLLFFVSISFSQEGKKGICSDFRTGKFVVKGYEEILILRSEHFQIEWDKEGKTVSYYYLKWVNDCQYKAKLIKTNYPNEEMMLGKYYVITFTDVNGNTCEFEVKIPGIQVADYGTLIKVE